MNVPLSDTIGLHIYRELMHREGRCAANWHVNYGPEALQKSPDPEAMVNLGLFSKFASVPMPLDVQRACSLTETVNARPCPNPLLSALTVCATLCIAVRELRKEAAVQKGNMSKYEKSVYPMESDVPVSELSVKYFGEKVWHTQKKTTPAPCTYKPWEPPFTPWKKRMWDVDHQLHTQEPLGAASRIARENVRGPQAPPPK